MADEVSADPVDLAGLAHEMLVASQGLGSAWRGAASLLAVPADAFGDGAAGRLVAGEHDWFVDAAGVAVGQFAGVLENLMDALYGAAFAYRETDAASARQVPPGPGS